MDFIPIDNIYPTLRWFSSDVTAAIMSQEPVCIRDFEDHAKAFLSKRTYGFYAGGADAQQTFQESKDAYKRLRLRPRVLRDVSSIDTSTTVLGQKIDFPVCISPTAGHKLAHPDGEIATAKAASHHGTCMVLSIWSTTLLEDVAKSSSGLKWFQIEIFQRLDVTASLVKRAEKEGYKAFVVTLDIPYFGRRYNILRDGSPATTHLSHTNYQSFLDPADYGTSVLTDPSLTWDAIQWLRTVTKLPIVVKGILTAEDAKLAVQHGVDAILVSSHGGRQLDCVPATVEVLPEIVAAVGDKVEVYVDGGVRFGTDVFKALALGARAVFVGRPILWGLAYNGEEGAKKVLEILKEELRLTMGLCGCPSLKDIAKEMVVHESYYRCKL